MSNFRDSAIADAIFTRTQQRVLGIVFSRPQHSHYLNEIVRIAGVGKGAVKRELDKLLAVNLVQIQRIGNQVHYSANRDSPIFHELHRIVSRTVSQESLIRNALVPIQDVLEQAIIYGDYAAGSESQEDPVNLVLVSDRLTPGGANAVLLPVESQIGRQLNITIISSNEYAERVSPRQSFISDVMAQPKIWLLERAG